MFPWIGMLPIPMYRVTRKRMDGRRGPLFVVGNVFVEGFSLSSVYVPGAEKFSGVFGAIRSCPTHSNIVLCFIAHEVLQLQVTGA